MSQESKDYSRGYNAGRRRTAAEMAANNARYIKTEGERATFRRQALIAVTASLFAGNRQWKMDGKEVTTSDDYVALADRIVDGMVWRAFK